MKILVVDDEQMVREAYRHVLEPDTGTSEQATLQSMAADLFGDKAADSSDVFNKKIDLTIASQGLEAISLVEHALAITSPFKVAFIDIRMPPGIDGKETARRIRALDPNINIVIVSAYSDHSVTDIATVAGPPDKIFYISKPFSSDEVWQMAVALSNRWDHDTQQIERLRQKIAELAASEARAQHAAYHDFLTGAPNRMAFQRELSLKVQDEDHDFALAFIDLDRFKHVNDTFGHGAGDDLLKMMYKNIRDSVPAGALVARLGGDEFGILFDDMDAQTATSACKQLITTCSQSVTVYSNSVQISASVGLLMSGDHQGCDTTDLMRFADIALFAAKRGGRRQVRVFDKAMDESVQFRQTIESGLRRAIERNEFILCYQPIVERSSLKTIGFEALLRWNSKEHGHVSPGVFIPVAEESALIHDVGDWVIQQALIDCKHWPELYISINFSPRQFKRENLIESLCRHADEAGVAYNRIQIEVTETAIFENVDRAAKTLNTLQQLGFRIALDDFGTGYSSLFNVKNFALDCIKIDKSFIDGLGSEAHAAAIVSSITHLARGLGLSVVAEGVETDIQCQALRVVGCSHMQGYLFGAAEPIELANKRLADENLSLLLEGKAVVDHEMIAHDRAAG